jgi:hypothetical protein
MRRFADLVASNAPQNLRVVFERRRRPMRNFGEIIIAAQSRRGGGMRLRNECGRSNVVKHASLPFQALFRWGRQAGPIAGIDVAKVTFRINMQTNRLEYVRAEVAAQIGQRNILMAVIRRRRGGDFDIAQQMTEIVHQGGGHDTIRLIRRFRKPGALQRVFELADRFTPIALPAALGQQLNDIAR